MKIKSLFQWAFAFLLVFFLLNTLNRFRVQSSQKQSPWLQTSQPPPGDENQSKSHPNSNFSKPNSGEASLHSSVQRNSKNQTTTSTHRSTAGSNVEVTGRNWPKPLTFSRTPFRTPPIDQLRSRPFSLMDAKWRWWSKVKVSVEEPTTLEGVEGRVSDRWILRSESAGEESNPQHFVRDQSLVLFDWEKKKYGILTGTLVIKARSLSSWTELINQSEFEIVHSQREVLRVYLRPKESPVNLDQFSQALQNDPRVENVEFEILTGQFLRG